MPASNPPRRAEDFNQMPADELQRILSRSPQQAAVWVGEAARQGIVQAQALYGQMLLDGYGMEADPQQALGWFRQAARGGSAMAMNMVGRCHELGWGARIDMAQAAHWYKAAAGRGSDWGMYNLATLLILGQGIEADRAQAFILLQKAAKLGHAKSMNLVGGFYEDGWEVAIDMSVAADWYQRAAEGGDFRGQFNLARMLADRGQIEAALEWLRRAPETATEAFIAKMRTYLQASPVAALRALATEF
jgi:TPR repeat protein